MASGPCPWGCGLGNMQALLGLGGLEALGVLRPLGGLEALGGLRPWGPSQALGASRPGGLGLWIRKGAAAYVKIGS